MTQENNAKKQTPDDTPSISISQKSTVLDVLKICCDDYLRQLLKQGAITVDGEKLADGKLNEPWNFGDTGDQSRVLKIGKRSWRIELDMTKRYCIKTPTGNPHITVTEHGMDLPELEPMRFKAGDIVRIPDVERREVWRGVVLKIIGNGQHPQQRDYWWLEILENPKGGDIGRFRDCEGMSYRVGGNVIYDTHGVNRFELVTVGDGTK